MVTKNPVEPGRTSPWWCRRAWPARLARGVNPQWIHRSVQPRRRASQFSRSLEVSFCEHRNRKRLLCGKDAAFKIRDVSTLRRNVYAISSRGVRTIAYVYRNTCHENSQLPLRNTKVGMTSFQADTQLREGPYDRLLQTLYSGEMDCNLTVELSVISARTLVAGHDYNLHSGIDFPEIS